MLFSRWINRSQHNPASHHISKFYLFLFAFIVCSLLSNCTSQPHQSGTINGDSRRPLPPETGIHEATLIGDKTAVMQHIDAGTDLNQADAYGSTPLSIAATFGRSQLAHLLLKAGADTETVNKQGSTPLHIAALMGRIDIVRDLLKQGANRYAINSTGSTAFDIVAIPFESDLPLYGQLSAGLAPLGLRLDYAQVKEFRPQIAELLRPMSSQYETVDYSPVVRTDWPVSTPQSEGLNADLIAEIYFDAGHHEVLDSLLVIKNDKLIAEGYFNHGGIDRKVRLASVTKSFVSASVGLALQLGCLQSLDQKMMDFFPEYASSVRDERKNIITIRHLLKMRAGYPWEETDPALWNGILTGKHVPLLLAYSLVNSPGKGFNYSNLSSHLLGVIVARSCKTDLRTFMQANLLDQINAEAGEWGQDLDGNYIGMGTLHLSAREAARMGLTYLRGGQFRGEEVVPVEWVKDSLQNYSSDTWIIDKEVNHVGRYFRELGYGYQWWRAMVGDVPISFAWGHGGQLIVLIEPYDMVIVTTSYPFHLEHNARSWRHERSVFNLVGKLISLL